MTSPAEGTSHQVSNLSYKDPRFKLILKYLGKTSYHDSFDLWWAERNSANYVKLSVDQKEAVKQQVLAVTAKDFLDVLTKAQNLPVETVPSITDAGIEGFNIMGCALSGLVAGGCIIAMLTGLFVTSSGDLTTVGVGLCCGIGLGIFFTLATLLNHWLMTCEEGSTHCYKKWFEPKAKDSYLALAQEALTKLKDIDQVLGKKNAISESQDKPFVATYIAKKSLFDKRKANKAKIERQRATFKNQKPKRRHSFSEKMFTQTQ